VKLVWNVVKMVLLDGRTTSGLPMTDCWRAKVPGGWFVHLVGAGPFFYPDPDHKWDGSSLP